MGIIETTPMLAKVVALCSNQSVEKITEVHCDVLCAPLQKLFPWASKEAIQYELLSNGLFQPFEWQQAEQLLQNIEIWSILEQEYERLRTLWHGPDVEIYILPITMGASKKNGIVYRNGLFLFVSEGLHVEELRALLAHEYNHICRLHYLNREPSQLTLQDSLIIEGLAECAVEELYGEQWLLPWTKRYTVGQVLPIWEKYFTPALQLVDVEKHQPFLFGNYENLPSWIGYCIGYRIVKSFQETNDLTAVQLLHMPTEIIVDGAILEKEGL
ncbi:DUF2268 domain-containing putative Zn-dependent protease [Metasolibacillus meyeri]|uniref:DUF2268 domain-containing putative Zn-dependent protease n=1 Tax=Metasolibacillus meyeri TaxID=1071052 RepID=A0AAW9NKH8_9BACL|nr:DUF2268 domain-containing putative Zn-dependent protease [Metasolibacillus meyeri]MEC1177930.1 DUF2268 domain-containing putative Zn-dependent protease [Metasolibacillus meyeri]